MEDEPTDLEHIVFTLLWGLFPAGIILEILGVITADQVGWFIVAAFGLPLAWLIIIVNYKS